MDIWVFLICIAACAAAGTTGAAFPPGKWYLTLNRPSWTPPNWVFPVAWTSLYLAMSAAAAIVAPIEGSGLGMALWGLQIALNTLWSPIFFGLRRFGAAIIVVVVLWLAVGATMLAFFQLSALAGLLFVPYLLWCTIAAALNIAMWRMNPGLVPINANQA
ncbi:MAG: TspO/MBR family protein [Pseudomonadota bacterium]